jgi:hypothetical protein
VQFYLVWPLALLIAWRCGWNLFWLTCTVAVISFWPQPRRRPNRHCLNGVTGLAKLSKRGGKDDVGLFATIPFSLKDENLAIEQTTGRQRLNIHGAIDLETGQIKMIEAEAIEPLQRSNSSPASRRSIPPLR